MFDDLVARGAARWPQLRLAPEAFVAWVSERSRGAQSSALCAEDLWLACACATQRPGALAAFEEAYRVTLQAGLRRLPEADRDDVAQALRLKLFTGTPPGIASYSGAGSLNGWLKITLARLVINAHVRGGAELADDEALLSLLSPEHDPEVQALKRELKGGFRELLEAAFGSLAVTDRQLLRAALAHHATVEQLAVVLGVPRSTAGRHLKAARERFGERLRGELDRRFGAGSLSARQLLQLVESQLDQSWWRLSGADES